MRTMFLFMMTSLDGYFEGPGHDLSWHNTDDEFVRFAIEQLQTVGTIVFGRRTYEMMAEFWSSDQAFRTDPGTAKLMNETPKLVFSHSLQEVGWQHSRLATADIETEVLKLKHEADKDVAVFGSNMLCVGLLKHRLLDELRIMVDPVAIGEGTPLFAGLDQKLPLSLQTERCFASGNVLLTYTPTY